MCPVVQAGPYPSSPGWEGGPARQRKLATAPKQGAGGCAPAGGTGGVPLFWKTSEGGAGGIAAQAKTDQPLKEGAGPAVQVRPCSHPYCKIRTSVLWCRHEVGRRPTPSLSRGAASCRVFGRRESRWSSSGLAAHSFVTQGHGYATAMRQLRDASLRVRLGSATKASRTVSEASQL